MRQGLSNEGGAEAGFSVVELLVGILAAVVVGAAAMTFLIVSLDQENAVSSRAAGTRQAAAALAQLTHDLSQAIPASLGGSAVTVSSSGTTTTINFSVPTQSYGGAPDYTTRQSETWTCQGTSASPGYCKRQVGSGANRVEIVGFESMTFADATGATLTPTFTDPAYLSITMQLQETSQLDNNQYGGTPTAVRGSQPITVQAGVDLRNET
jgi:type II secretory pathway pseudopilin PulG